MVPCPGPARLPCVRRRASWADDMSDPHIPGERRSAGLALVHQVRAAVIGDDVVMPLTVRTLTDHLRRLHRQRAGAQLHRGHHSHPGPARLRQHPYRAVAPVCRPRDYAKSPAPLIKQAVGANDDYALLLQGPGRRLLWTGSSRASIFGCRQTSIVVITCGSMSPERPVVFIGPYDITAMNCPGGSPSPTLSRSRRTRPATSTSMRCEPHCANMWAGH